MQAIFQNSCGGSEFLQFGTRPLPTLHPHQVMVRARASSINPRDCMIRSGQYQLQFLVPRFPLILGSDVAGIVTEVGSAVTQFRPGEAVMGLKNPSDGLGCHAEFVAINASALVHKPAALTFQEAGGFPLCALTAWQALVGQAKLGKGQNVLIIGASGGVGSFAVQIAVALGASVTGVCSAVNHAWVNALGAGNLVDYQTQDYHTLGAPKTLPQFDVVFDTIGRDSLNTCRRLLMPGGVFVSTIPSPQNLLQGVLTQLVHTISPSQTRAAVVMVKPRQPDLQALATLVEKGQLRTVIDRVYPLSAAAQAHDHSRSRRARGKLILSMQEDSE